MFRNFGLALVPLLAVGVGALALPSNPRGAVPLQTLHKTAAAAPSAPSHDTLLAQRYGGWRYGGYRYGGWHGGGWRYGGWRYGGYRYGGYRYGGWRYGGYRYGGHRYGGWRYGGWYGV